MAKHDPSLTKITPHPEGERHFADKVTVYDSPNDRFLDPKNGIFKVMTKVFNRKYNHYGYDITDSIDKMDEGANYEERASTAHKRKVKKRHLYVDGQWIGVDASSKSNAEAIKTLRQRLRLSGKHGSPAVSKEVDEKVVNEVSNELLGRYIKKSGRDMSIKSYAAGRADNQDQAEKYDMQQSKRMKGIGKAVDKMTDKAKIRSKAKEVDESEHWIQKAIKHPGSMTRAAKKAGETNSEYEEEHKHSKGKAGERARLALNLKHMHEDNLKKHIYFTKEDAIQTNSMPIGNEAKVKKVKMKNPNIKVNPTISTQSSALESISLDDIRNANIAIGPLDTPSIQDKDSFEYMKDRVSGGFKKYSGGKVPGQRKMNDATDPHDPDNNEHDGYTVEDVSKQTMGTVKDNTMNQSSSIDNKNNSSTAFNKKTDKVKLYINKVRSQKANPL